MRSAFRPPFLAVLRRERGLSLVEVVVAMGVLVVVITTVLALLPAAMDQESEIVRGQQAADWLSRIEADLRLSAPQEDFFSRPAQPFAPALRSKVLGLPPVWSQPTGTFAKGYVLRDGTLQGVTQAVGVPEDAVFRITLEVTDSTPSIRGAPTTVHAVVSWPAAPEPEQAAGLRETVLALPK